MGINYISFQEAKRLAITEGCFVSSDFYSHDQSIHSYKGKLYFEDGAVIPSDYRYNIPKKYIDRFYVKYTKDQVDFDKLKMIHDEFNGMTLDSNRTYEESIIK